MKLNKCLYKDCNIIPCSFTVLCSVLLIFSSVIFNVHAATQEAQGIFSHEQASRGKAFYEQHCASCHGLDLQGASASALKSEAFMVRWSSAGKSLGDLVYVIRTTMPLGNAGIIDKQSYLDVTTYLLEQNGQKAGPQSLLADDPKLESITVGSARHVKASLNQDNTCPTVDYFSRNDVPSSASPSQTELDHAGSNKKDWLLPDHSYSGQRFSPLTQITRQNAASLKNICSYETGDNNPFQTYPLVHDGVLFFTTNHSTFAIKADSCQEIWRYDRAPRCSEIWGRSRGAALKDGLLIRGTPDGYLLAINANTGKRVWEKYVVDPEFIGMGIAMPPLVYKDKIIIGPTTSEIGLKGWIAAFRLQDGKPLWKFHVVPEAGNPAAKSWGSDEALKHGGGGVWTPFTVDTKTDTIYLATGNPSPAYFDEQRPGDNLYTSALLALDANSGALKWYQQLISGDYHDWDMTHASPLISTKSKQLVFISGKDGIVRAIDRNSHDIVYSIPVSYRENTDAKLSASENTHFCPGLYGGVQWNGPAYNPQLGQLFVPSIEWCGSLRLTDEVRYIPGGFYLGGLFSMDPVETSFGKLSAYDVETGDPLWSYRSDRPMTAAVTSTASDLIFTGEMTGHFLTLDAKTGDPLYRFDTDAPLNGGIITYSVNDKQYIAVAAGAASSIWYTDPAQARLLIFSLPD